MQYLNFVMKDAFQRILFVYVEVKITSKSMESKLFFLENFRK